MKNEFRVFPDIRLICDDMPETGYTGVLEISCCIRGICEYNIDNEYSYLSKGNCIVLMHSPSGRCKNARSANCRTVTLLIESNLSDTEISRLIGTSDCLQELRTDKAYILHDERITEIFSELYKQCINKKTDMIKIKTLEFLVMLKGQKFRPDSRGEKIKRAGEFICSHLSEHYTVNQLSEMFETDRTTLKNLFRQVYGCPIYTYTKNRKMFRATEMLKNTDMKVIDIAEEVGYSNASKFSSAFRDVIGVNPKYYQMEHKASDKIIKSNILRQTVY